MSYYPQTNWPTDPYAPAQGYAQQRPVAAPYGYGYPPAPARKSRSGLIIAVVVGAVAIAFMVFVAPLLFIDKMSSDVDDLISNSTGGNTEQILADDIDVTFGTFTRDSRFTTMDRGKLPVTVKNKGDERATFSIQVEAVDSDGDRITEDSVYVASLAPGQSVSEDAFTLAGDDDYYYKLKRATFRIASVTKY